MNLRLWIILPISIIAFLAVFSLSSNSNSVANANASSSLVCVDAKSIDVQDIAPIPLNTTVKCTTTTNNQRVIDGEWIVYDGFGQLYISHPFKSSSDTISFVTPSPKLWTVQVSYFDKTGEKYSPPLPLTQSSVSFVVSSYQINLPPRAVITVIR